MRITQRSLFIFLPLLTFILLFMGWRGLYAQSGSSMKPFPSINLPLLSNDAKHFAASDLQGSVTLVNLWATWCAACGEEHPYLLWIKKNYPIKMVGINFEDDPGAAQNLLNTEGNPYDTVLEDVSGATALSLGVEVLPQTFVVDKKGKIRYQWLGVIDESVFKFKILPVLQKLERE